MPVNPLPILIPLLVLWGGFAYVLFRWRRWAGGLFVALSVVALTMHIMNTGVERRFDEQMTFRVIGVGDYRTLELTNSRGETVSEGSPDIVARISGRSDRTIQVSMVGWYNYGRLSEYRVESIDGVRPERFSEPPPRWAGGRFR